MLIRRPPLAPFPHPGSGWFDVETPRRFSLFPSSNFFSGGRAPTHRPHPRRSRADPSPFVEATSGEGWRAERTQRVTALSTPSPSSPASSRPARRRWEKGSRASAGDEVCGREVFGDESYPTISLRYVLSSNPPTIVSPTATVGARSVPSRPRNALRIPSSVATRGSNSVSAAPRFAMARLYRRINAIVSRLDTGALRTSSNP